MIRWRSTVTHLALLAAGAVFAYATWSREPGARQGAGVAVEIWEGQSENVSEIRYDGDDIRVRAASKRDDLGRYFVVDIDKEATVARDSSQDAGAPAQEASREQLQAISVEGAAKLAELLAPLRALRSLGTVPKADYAEFGLDEPDGKVTVRVGGETHSLLLGARTPGGADRYALVPGTGRVIVVDGELVRGLQFAPSRLVERQLHGFEASAIRRLEIQRGAESRQFVPVEGKAEAWAPKASPQAVSEAVGNWMTKLERLRVTKYVQAPKPDPSLSFRVEYIGGSGSLGFIELSRADGADGPVYYARTERSRWFAEVLPASAEPVEQDLPALFD